MPRTTTPVSLSTFVIKEIRRQILDGSLAPGVRLYDSEIATDLGISRAPVREALKQLQGLGLVDENPRRGVFVHGFTAEEVTDLIETRILLECAAVERAAARVSELDLTALALALDSIAEAAETGGRGPVVAAEAAFHLELVALSGLNELSRLYAFIASRLQMLMMMAGQTLDEDLGGVFDEHVPLLEVVRAGEPSSAREAVKRHIRGVYPITDGALYRGET